MKTTSYLSRFNYQLSGEESGRKWVFLHGLMGYGSNWRKIVSGLSTSERVLTFDQRGHGRSWKPHTGYAPMDYAEDLFLITEELDWDRFILVGHSMGGRNALCFAHHYPQKVQKLIIEDIGPDSSISSVEYYKKMLESVPTPFASKLEAKEFMMNIWPQLGIIHENVMTLGQYLYSNLEDKENGQVDWRFSKEAILSSVIQGRATKAGESAAWDELRNLNMKTLIIRGENSKELSKDVFMRMKASNPLIETVEIANAGHWVHADQASEFLRIIKEFANQ